MPSLFWHILDKYGLMNTSMQYLSNKSIAKNGGSSILVIISTAFCREEGSFAENDSTTSSARKKSKKTNHQFSYDISNLSASIVQHGHSMEAVSRNKEASIRNWILVGSN